MPSLEQLKYFQIGFKKCGTTSIAAFFDRSGIPAVHYDRGKLGRRMQLNFSQGLPLISGYEQYDVITNMEYLSRTDWFDGFRHYEALMQEYEDSRFILNTRGKESWLKSMIALGESKPGVMAAYYHNRYGTNDVAELTQIWSADWDSHHHEVISRIPADRLLVFNIETDSPEILCDFAELPRSMARHYSRENPTMNRFGKIVARCLPLAFKRTIPNPIKMPVKRLFGTRSG